MSDLKGLLDITGWAGFGDAAGDALDEAGVGAYTFDVEIALGGNVRCAGFLSSIEDQPG